MLQRASDNLATGRPALPYVAPFALFVILLAVERSFNFAPEFFYPIRVLAVAAVFLLFSRHVIQWRVTHTAGSVLLGVAVFLVWIAPDLLWPEYRRHWLFLNPLTGAAESSIRADVRADATFLFFRLAGSLILVPVIEEIFWRGWLMRYLISRDFNSVPLGAYAARAFWISALLFASEHGPYWDVGLVAGMAYNWWIIRTHNLASCVVAHVVTNLCLAVYVLYVAKWEYWL